MGTERELSSILVGDHLGQVKKVLWPSAEISVLKGLSTPAITNPIVSIKPIGDGSKFLIGKRTGEVYIYDVIQDEVGKCDIKSDEGLVRALPKGDNDIVLVHQQNITFSENDSPTKVKKGPILDATTHDNRLAIVGKNIPLRIFDLSTKSKVYEGDRPDEIWSGVAAECEVKALDFVGGTRVATCSKSDSVIRIFDTRGKTKPIISVNLNQTAFNEYGEPGRFMSIASTGDSGHSVVVGSNVGQLYAIDLRFNVKEVPRKKLQPKTWHNLGGFKGARGGTMKDISIVPFEGEEKGKAYKVISCCLDRYMRIHNFTRKTRKLDRHVYMTTRPLCCAPVYYGDV